MFAAMDLKITPKSLILSLLQVSGKRSMPVKTLVCAGHIFGFTENTIRVATTRLIREGTIESDERGQYRLSSRGTLFSRYIESWRAGEKRLVKWDGGWLCCWIPKTTARRRAEIRSAFGFVGFGEGLPNLWVRPDNLTLDRKELEKLICRIGKLEDGQMFVARAFSENLIASWRNNLWPVEAMCKKQKAHLAEMKKSTDRIEKMPLENALVESFLVGSEAVRLLITDPMLPQEMADTGCRAALHEAMLRYDETGKRIWSKRFEEIRIDRAPTQCHMVAV